MVESQEVAMLTPVKAVPERNQATGSRYQGHTERSHKLAAKEMTEIATALQDLQGLISNTCRQSKP